MVMQETFVAHVNEDDDDETPMANASDTSASCPTINKEQIKMGNRHAEAYKSGSSTKNITIVTYQGS
jgi:hypothetical protein